MHLIQGVIFDIAWFKSASKYKEIHGGIEVQTYK